MIWEKKNNRHELFTFSIKSKIEMKRKTIRQQSILVSLSPIHARMHWNVAMTIVASIGFTCGNTSDLRGLRTLVTSRYVDPS